MHDTAMLMGAMGWDRYDCRVGVITPFFPSSGTGRINAIFPVSPMSRDLAGVGEPRGSALSPRT